jgi:hypothetical protein
MTISENLHQPNKTIQSLRLFLWGSLFGVVIVDMLLLADLHLSVNWQNALPVPISMMILIPLPSLLLLLQTQIMRRYGAICVQIYKGFLYYIEVIGLTMGLLLAVFIMMQVMIIITGHIIYYDAEIIKLEKFFGFNWNAYVEWVSQHPWIHRIYLFSYGSFIAQSYLLLTALFICQKYEQLYRFTAAHLFGLLLTTLIVAIFPSEGMIAFTHFDVKLFPNVVMNPGYIHLELLNSLRAGRVHVLFEQPMVGLVTFPSFHVLAAVIYCRGFWYIPLLRWFFLLINGLMIISAPVVGGHYFIDCFAGVMLGLVSLWLSSLLGRGRKKNTAASSLA